MILTADPIGAGAACAAGLVNEVVPQSDLIGAAVALARRIAARSPLAVAACLASVTRGINVPIDEGRVSRFRSSQALAATSGANFGIEGTLATL